MREHRDAGCKEAGQIVCTDNCSQVSVCLGDGSSETEGFVTMPVETCATTTKCSAINMTCVTPSKSDCHAIDSSFTCYATGYLPDPYNCSVYYLCLVVGQPPALVEACPDGWAYDPLTTDCGMTQLDRVCTEGPVPACTTVGQNGPVPENPTIYYICMNINDQLTPILFKCEHGQVWNEGNGECVNGFFAMMH